MTQMIKQFQETISRMDQQISDALPKHMPTEKFNRSLRTYMNENPKLLDCNRTSLLGAVMKCAQSGLFPDGREAALVKFKDQVTFMPMVSGLLKLVRNSGEIKSITSHVVFNGEEFDYRISEEGEKFNHVPDFLGKKDDPIGAYALAITKDGGKYLCVMSKKEIMDVKSASRSSTSGPWAGKFKLEMWKKTVIRRLTKTLPMSTDKAEVFEKSRFDYEPKQLEIKPVESTDVEVVEQTQPKQLEAALEKE